MKKRIVAMILLLTISVAGCGTLDEKNITKATEKKEENVTVDEVEIKEDAEVGGEEIVTEETMEETPIESAPVEVAKETETKKAEAKKTTQKTETKKNETPVPTVTTPVVTTPETKSCEHNWEQEEFYYDIFKKVTFGCNGCGLALFEWSDDKNSVEHIENLYFHEPCPTDRFPEPCYGGGYHNESVTIGFCGLCSSGVDDPEGRVVYRQCMWTEMGKRCSKNEVMGTYEKVEFDQNFFMYYDSCKCGKNMIFVNGRDDDYENAGKGIIFGKEKCTICGIYKEN